MRKVLTVTSVITAVCVVALCVRAFVQPGGAQVPVFNTSQPSVVRVLAQTSESIAPLETEWKILGYTERKTPIKGLFVGRGKRHVIVLGAIHGDEPSSAAVVESFATLAAKNESSKDMTVIVIPVLNPDGFQAGSRTNHSGVDINRNFPAQNWERGSRRARYYPGEQASSEPETRAMIELIKDTSPVLIISVHAPLFCVNWDGPAQKIAEKMAEANQYPLCEDIGYSTPGSLGSYAGKDLSIPVITLELREAHSSDKLIDEGVAALQAAIKWVAVNPN
jgi:protein MpaA